MSTTTTTTATTTTSSKNKSNVKELKRLFESKKSSSSTLAIDNNSSSSGGSSNPLPTHHNSNSKLKVLFERKGDIKSKSAITVSELEKNEDKHKDKPASSIVRSKSTSFHSLSLNFDNAISQGDKKYYFYVNEAIRKNIPIVPSLAIRRKSLDLTNSPIKGSLYAQKYTHSYSPSTRTIMLSKTSNKSNGAIDAANNSNTSSNSTGGFDYSSIKNHGSSKSGLQNIKTLNRNDRSWIKNQTVDDMESLSTTPKQMSMSKSTLELTPSKYLSKEEPIKLASSGNSIVDSNTSSNTISSSRQPIHHTQSVSKLKLTFSKPLIFSKFLGDKDKDDKNNNNLKSTPPSSNENISTPGSPPLVNNSDMIPTNKKESKSKLLSWVSLRRVKRSNTVDINVPSNLLESPPKHKHPTTGGKPPIHSNSSLSLQSSSTPSSPTSPMSPSGGMLSPSRLDIPTIFIDNQSNSPSSSPSNPSIIVPSSLKSISSPTSPNLSPSSSPSTSGIYLTNTSTTESPSASSGGSPSNSDQHPVIINKRIVSVAKIISKSSTLPLGLIQSPALSAPSSPVISPIKEALLKSNAASTSSNSILDKFPSSKIPISSSTAELSVATSKTSALSDNDIKLSTIEKLNNKHLTLETAVVAATRGRSISVGQISEAVNRFEVVQIPPLKVHCHSLEDCLEAFQKPDPPHGRRFILDIGNCSLGDEGLIQISDEIPGNLEIADLSWNDLTFEGLAAFYQMLSRTKPLITSLSLQGNSISPDSIQLLLDSIEVDSVSKKDYKGFGLNLKETSVENEGADNIASYLEQNKFPNIIGLNLTCASVTDMGMSSFSMALKKSISLTTLILDENYLGDDGAVLLADGLKFNTTLTHLQLRNTDIGERGTVEICNSCKFNNSIEVLDLSLNPWQLGGEIALQSLTVHKQQQYIHQKKKMSSATSSPLFTISVPPKIQWKDDGMESNLDVEEVEQVVIHFGTDKIIDVLMIGIQFTPLVEKEKLLECINVETKHLSKIFQNIISTNNTDDHISSLKLLVQMLPTHLEKHAFVHSFINNLPSLISLLDRPQIDFLILDILDFFAILIKSGYESCFEIFNQYRLFPKALDLLFQFPKNNILHQGILNLVQGTANNYLSLYQESTFTLEFINKISKHLLQENKLDPGKRSANYGHLLELAKTINTNYNLPIQNEFWKSLVTSVLDKEFKLQESYLCGFIPDRNQKLNPDILSKFEKEFKK